HNPESISPHKELILREDRCVRCGDCAKLCRNAAIREEGGAYVTSRDLCKQCGDCTKLCYAEAREIVGYDVTVEELGKEIRKDRVFFEQSGGGVTFSGGEPFLQHEFLKAALEMCRQSDFHTTVDTTGFTSAAILEDISPFIDLFLYDLKTLDDDKHQDYTGVSNRVILENLRLLSRAGKNVIVRVPVIPGVNDTAEDIDKIGTFVASLRNIPEIQLLPYHQTGVEKYQRLGLHYAMDRTQSPTAERMDEIARQLGTHVSLVSIGG
ncbi:MAG TPA: glycyl-radical enzyme activating protein, partial [Bacteroidota bacterium]|nr:glycyl-radical enzyme activating protein [Bacteroidota bacterium]